MSRIPLAAGRYRWRGVPVGVTFAALDEGSPVGEVGASNVAAILDEAAAVESLPVPFNVHDEGSLIAQIGVAAAWADDFERVDILGTKWREIEQATTAHQAATSVTRSRNGSRSARFELRDGDIANGADERQQLNGALLPGGAAFEPTEGDDYYIAISLWFEAGFPGLENNASWQVFLAFVSFDERGSGPLKLGHGGANGRLCIEGVDQNDPAVGNGFYWMNDTATETGGWHDFVIHVKFSQNPSVGFVELWHREPSESVYSKQTLTDSSLKRYFATLLDTQAFLKLGLYRSNLFTTTGVMYADRLVVAHSFELAAIPGLVA